MNPEIDLANFRRGGGGGSVLVAGAPGGQTRTLVAPPRRILTRYVLPISLLLAFSAVGGYALRNAFIPTTEVKVVLPVPASGGPVTGSETEAAESGNTDAKGETTVMETIPGTPLFQAPGWIEPYPFRKIISALGPGIVRRLNILEGQEITSGTVVAELADEDVRIAVGQAEAELNMKKAELEAAEVSLANPLALREAVRTGQAEVERLKAEKNRTQQSLSIAQRQMEVDKSLAVRGAGGTFAAQKAAMEARGAELAVAEIDAKIRSAEAVLESAKERLKLLVEEKNRVLVARAAVTKAQAALEEARYLYRQRKIIADTTGTVMTLFVGEGATLSFDRGDGLRIAAVYDPSQLQLRADVPIAEVSKLTPGMPVEIKVDALPERSFRGELTRIVHEADLQKNTLPVKVRIFDPDPALKPEMIARLQFSSAPRTVARSSGTGADSGTTSSAVASGGGSQSSSGASVLIPATLVPDDAKEAKLWFVSASQTAHQRNVQLGPKMPNGLRAVLSGIETPDKIIASNTEKLKEGSRVKIAATE